MRLGEGRNVSVEMRVTPREFTKSGQKLFIQHQAIAAGVSCDDGHPFVKRETKPFWISKRLVFSDQTELIADVTQEREFSLC